MDTSEPEEYITLRPSTRNYAEFFNKRLNRPYSCTRYADPNDCDCDDVKSDMVGFTDFWKIRLNLTTMRIVDDDFTFSTSASNRQKYGRAGDCYSDIEDCIEGSFSVDLTGTSFRISDVVTWFSHGNSARHHIHKMDGNRRVYGRCGGNCGYCLPDPKNGLLVEVT
nr:A disintegrin and metalloproteinase with thrombospondin motifs 20-like [Onthophagus taurus]